MADHLLSEGMGAATLRPLAAAAGVSDRMLLYYFNDKSEVLTATLDRIATRMIAKLDSAVSARARQPFPVLLEQLWNVLESDDITPFMRLWLELIAGAGRGLHPHSAVAGTIVDGFHAWVAARLEPEHEAGRLSRAPLFLAALEGTYLLRAIGRPAMAICAKTAMIEAMSR